MQGLFVYGTLKQGEPNYRHVEPLIDDVLNDCYIFGELYDLGPYPALLTPGSQKIRGELLISHSLADLLRITDEIEGDQYERVAVEVYREPNAVPMDLAWVYRYSRDTSQLNRLIAGEWRPTR